MKKKLKCTDTTACEVRQEYWDKNVDPLRVIQRVRGDGLELACTFCGGVMVVGRGIESKPFPEEGITVGNIKIEKE